MTNGGSERSERPTRKTATATKAAAPAAGNGSWTLDTGFGTMSPRSALDVLADVRQKVATSVCIRIFVHPLAGPAVKYW